jgi:hypothetical protein
MSLPDELRAFFSLNGNILYWIFLGPFRGQPIRLVAVFQQTFTHRLFHSSTFSLINCIRSSTVFTH